MHNTTMRPNPKQESDTVYLKDGDVEHYDRIVIKANGWISCWSDTPHGKEKVVYPPHAVAQVYYPHKPNRKDPESDSTEKVIA